MSATPSVLLRVFFDTPPHHCRLAKGKLKPIQRELKKVLKMAGRMVLGRQVEIKQNKQQKQQRLVTREALTTCQSLARAKIPELLDDIEKAPPRHPPTRYRFFGYLGAYIASIYGHRTGVLTCMRVKEVKEALGNDGLGYLINVRDHKTLRKFGLAQIYLDGEEYGWCKRWLDLRKRCVATNPYFFSSFGKGQAKDMVRYVRRAWAEMGLLGSPSLLDVRSAVATYMKLRVQQEGGPGESGLLHVPLSGHPGALLCAPQDGGPGWENAPALCDVQPGGEGAGSTPAITPTSVSKEER
ncbi:uncharacterized protein LOC131967764 [Centropristis striata]|uniref:uncharacterized protein LOC131967764 n=1 Tax=Centropristis striata TaxID=184440 RepID=UPI0027E02EE6|nr:uncharacterized protein LOC131967764 [Centropristis striata]